MLEALGVLHQVLRFSEWTGLGLGMLAGLVALSIYVPPLRSLATHAALALAVGYAALMYGDKVGRADVTAQWNAAIARAEKEREARDAAIHAEIEGQYRPIVAALERQVADNQREVDKDERAPASVDRCPLGSQPLRLRNRR